MRIDEVRAAAFGPLRGASLRLGPGLNVVHGPNEVGKSSWFAATYAGLAGRRKARGRGTLGQAEFRNRHKPWSGSQWSAGVTVTLDDGLVLALEHDLTKGESRIVDSQSGRVVPVSELAKRMGVDLTTESTLDGTRLLGLNRDSARATIFAGQADVLRVLEGAGQLQEFLERAATSEVADATAEGALAWLSEMRSELVGSEHVGKKPLRSRAGRLEQARALSGERRDQLIRLVGIIGERQAIGEVLKQAKNDVDRADRMKRWTDIHSLKQRLAQAELLSAQLDLSGSSASDIDEDRIRVATMILGALDSGVDAQPLPEGPSATDLEAEIAALPDHPEGDLEPRREVLDARDVLARATTALQTHAGAAQEVDTTAPDLDLSADELRSMADVLELPPPVVEPDLTDELAALRAQDESAAVHYRDAQAEYEASIQRNEQLRLAHTQAVEQHAALVAEFERVQSENARRQAAAREAAVNQAAAAKRRGMLIAGGGVLLLLAGIVLVVSGQLGVGGVVALLGGAVLVVGLLAGRRTTPDDTSGSSEEHPPVPPRQPELPQLEQVSPPVAPVTNPRVMELQVALRTQENALRQHEEQVERTRSQLRERSLAADPGLLRRLARSMDDAGAALARRRHHKQVGQSMRSQRDGAARELAHSMGHDVGDEISDEDVQRLNRAVDAYVEACRGRAVTAQRAHRRADLAAALEQRKQLEHDRAAAAAERSRQVRAVVEFVMSLGEEAEELPVDQAALRLREWLAQQQVGRTEHAARAEIIARLDQLLDGRDVGDWQRELDTLIEDAGPEPDDIPADYEGFRSQVAARHELVLSRAGALAGQQEQLSHSLGSVAEAVEEEAAAERALAEVQTLRTCIDAATAQLNLAKDRAHANIAPALEAKVRPLLPRVTQGRYLDVMVDPSDLSVKVTEASGAVREARLLSQGTMEQIFLLLRIALAQVLASGHETAPLILDDVTVQSDQERTVAIMEMLRQLSADCQVVVFTQEQEVIDWARANLTDDRESIVALAEGQAH